MCVRPCINSDQLEHDWFVRNVMEKLASCSPPIGVSAVGERTLSKMRLISWSTSTGTEHNAADSRGGPQKD